MSVYIPGMEKSKTCAFCRFCEELADTQLGSCAFCVVDGKTRVADTPPKDCPLVPVPEHGDLVDRDTMREIAISLLDEAVTDQEAYGIRKMWSRLGQMPVYISAEEGE